jgi:hypothetical protein
LLGSSSVGGYAGIRGFQSVQKLQDSMVRKTPNRWRRAAGGYLASLRRDRWLSRTVSRHMPISREVRSRDSDGEPVGVWYRPRGGADKRGARETARGHGAPGGRDTDPTWERLCAVMWKVANGSAPDSHLVARTKRACAFFWNQCYAIATADASGMTRWRRSRAVTTSGGCSRVPFGARATPGAAQHRQNRLPTSIMFSCGRSDEPLRSAVTVHRPGAKLLEWRAVWHRLEPVSWPILRRSAPARGWCELESSSGS